MEDTQKLLFEILSRISALEVRAEHLNKSFDGISARLEEIEESHQKTLGAIQFATATTAIIVTLLVTFANLWIDKKITDHDKINEKPQQEIQQKIKR
jgi:hypothetical protein